MTTELWITIGIALIGWIWAIAQFLYKRRWQKNDMIATRRYDAYSGYMRKLEEIIENIRKDPNGIFRISIECYTKIMTGDLSEADKTLTNFNQQLFDYLKRFTSCISIINQELNSISLIASNELLEKLKEQKSLIMDYCTAVENCLNVIDVKDSNTFQPLTTLGQDDRWSRFTSLNDEIIALMRKEIDIK